jgi:hypothetical protein
MNWGLKKVLLWALVKKPRSKAKLKSDKPLLKNLLFFFWEDKLHMDWRMQRKQLHTAFSQWKRRVQKSSVNIHLLVTKTCAIQDLSPRITKTLQKSNNV